MANASQTIKKKLLSEDRTFDQALKAAQANELAEKEPKQLQRNIDTSSARMLAVNAVHRSPTPHQASQKQTDPKQKNGSKTVFQVWLITCSYCGKPGHLAKACFKKKKDGWNSTTYKVTATPTPETASKGEKEDTDFSFYRSYEKRGILW